MHKDTAALLQLYQYLDRFYQQSTTLADAEKLALLAEQLAVSLLKLCQQQPALMQAQLALTPGNPSYCSKLAIKQVVLLAALAKAGQWPLVVLEELLACSIFRHCGIVSLLAQNSEGQPPNKLLLSEKAGLLTLKAAGAAFSHRHWRQLLTDSSLDQQQKPASQQTPYAGAIRFCAMLAAQLTPSVHQSVPGLEQLLPALLAKSAASELHYFAGQLAKVGSGLWLTGRLCSDTIGEVALITTTTPQLTGCLFDPVQKKLTATINPLTEPSLKLLPPRLLPDAGWLDLLIPHHPRPPETAELFSLARLQQLDTSLAVSRQVSWLEQYPDLTTALLQQASKRSRQQLPIHSVSHAVALIGADQLPLLLRLAWLEQQAALCRQPYQSWFLQLENCLATVLRFLATHSKRIQLTETEAKLLAGCFVLPLLQDDFCRFLPLQPAKGKMSALVLFCHQAVWQQTDYQRAVLQSLAAVSLPLMWQDAVLSYREPTEIQSQYSQQQCAQVLLNVSWRLTETIFYGVSTHPALLEQSFRQARHTLDLPQWQLSDWLELCLTHSACYWPTQHDL